MLLILTVLLLVYGTKRLPEIGRSLGSGVRELRHSLTVSPADDERAPRGSVPPSGNDNHAPEVRDNNSG
jgi:TatA/E family protein of Tat protein translocase